jgi:hypothetical protein
LEEKMKFLAISILILILGFSCKKSEERKCWKGLGSDSSVEIPLDSVNFFNLNKGVKYRIYQDTLRKVVVKGGENVIGLVDVVNEDCELTISNLNKCNFLRDSERVIEVEIHYPYLNEFYIEPSDSIVFENTVISNSLNIELREGGGSMLLDVDVNTLGIVVSKGTADYTLTGSANSASIKIQHNGFADASGFSANNIYGYSNSTADLRLNLDSCDALIGVNGPGNVYYTGVPLSLIEESIGSGQLLEY